MVVDNGGDVYVTGSYDAASGSDWYTARYALTNGSIVWEKDYSGNGTSNDQMENIQVVGSTVYLAGYMSNMSPPARWY